MAVRRAGVVTSFACFPHILFKWRKWVSFCDLYHLKQRFAQISALKCHLCPNLHTSDSPCIKIEASFTRFSIYREKLKQKEKSNKCQHTVKHLNVLRGYHLTFCDDDFTCLIKRPQGSHAWMISVNLLRGILPTKVCTKRLGKPSCTVDIIYMHGSD